MFFKLGCNSFFSYFFPHAFAKIIPVAQALLCVRKEYLHQQEKQFTEQLKLITEISIWKQSKPRIVEIAGSPCSGKCSVLHGGKAGKWHTRGIVLLWEKRHVGNIFQSFTLMAVCVWSSRPKGEEMLRNKTLVRIIILGKKLFTPLRNTFLKVQHLLC